MSKLKITKSLLYKYRISNGWNLTVAARNKLYISFLPSDTGRGGHSAKWQVIGLGFNTDDKAWWGDYGRKTFNINGRDDKEPKLKKAIAWVKETYGLNITDKDVFGDWHVEGTLDKLREYILAKQSTEVKNTEANDENRNRH
jgi:hypothetical protein